MSGQQTLGLKLGQPVETKPASEPVKLPWWQAEHFRLWFEQGAADSERAVEIRGGKVIALVPAWFAKSHSGLVGKSLTAEPKVGQVVEAFGADIPCPTWIEKHVDHPFMTGESFVREQWPRPSYNSRRQWLLEEKRTKESA